MGRRGGEQGGPSTRVFLRPVTMLAVGLASGLAMWWVLTADGGRGTVGAAAGPRGAIGAAAGPPNRPAEAVATHPASR
jgi:hypothetical protein